MERVVDSSLRRLHAPCLDRLWKATVDRRKQNPLRLLFPQGRSPVPSVVIVRRDGTEHGKVKVRMGITPPGITSLPVASIFCAPCISMPASREAIFPSRISRSATRVPVAVTTVPPRISVCIDLSYNPQNSARPNQ